MIAKKRSAVFGVIATFACLMTMSHANGALIGVQQAFPDIASSGLTTTFTDATDTLLVEGGTIGLTEVSGGTVRTFSTNHTLEAIVNDSGDFVSGTLTFDTNSIPALLNDSGTFPTAFDLPTDTLILSIMLTGMGVEGTGDLTVMDFTGVVTAVHPNIASLFGVGAEIGVIYNPGNGATFSGAWDEDWGGTVGATNVFVPEPTSGLIAIAGVALAATRRRQKA